MAHTRQNSNGQVKAEKGILSLISKTMTRKKSHSESTEDSLENELFVKFFPDEREMTLDDLNSKDFLKRRKSPYHSREGFVSSPEKTPPRVAEKDEATPPDAPIVHRADPNAQGRKKSAQGTALSAKKKSNSKISSLSLDLFSGLISKKLSTEDMSKKTQANDRSARGTEGTRSEKPQKKKFLDFFGTKKKSTPTQHVVFASHKELDRDSTPVDVVLSPKSIDDLPKNLQKILTSSKLPDRPTSEEFEIIQSILYFQTKTKFQSVEENKKKQRNLIKSQNWAIPKPASKVRPPTSPSQLFRSADPLESYKIEKQEGRGGFGTVYRAYSKKNSSSAFGIKVMTHISPRDQEYNLAEIGLLSFCRHPNIVKYYQSYLIDKEIWCVMEFLQGGTLSHAAKSYQFTENQVAFIAGEIMKGLAYLHSENLVHRDVKSSNIMLSTEAEVKIIDFGLCIDVSDGPKTSMVGSPYWMPPEMILRKPYAHKVDIYSYGICLTELFNGSPPFNNQPTRSMFIAATRGYEKEDYAFEEPEKWSATCKNFVLSCVRKNPDERPSATEALNNPFLKQAESQEMMKQVLSGIFIMNAILPF